MKHHLNTLFVTTPGAYLRKQGEAVAVRVERQEKLRVPLNNLGSIACFGRVSCSVPLMGACAERGIGLAFLTDYGRLVAVVNGFSPGNVLLRREQYRTSDDLTKAAAIARGFVVGKLANFRTVLRRAGRELSDQSASEAVGRAASRIDQTLRQLDRPIDLDSLRGIEGDSTAAYFSVFAHLITANRDAFRMDGRSRRPPLDPLNALLSFLYSLLANDARSACEAAGLDVQVGFLHRDRPGRPSLALDLIEEFRPILADRLAIALINRQQVRPSGFRTLETGGVLMDDGTRRTVIAQYQKRKQEAIVHPFLGEKVSIGLLVHLQARLLARHLRGDVDAYPPCVWK